MPKISRVVKFAPRECINSVIVALLLILPSQVIAEDIVIAATEMTAEEKAAAEAEAADAPTLPAVKVETTQRDRSHTMTVITRDDTEGEHFTNINDALFSGIPGVVTSRRSETGFGGPNAGFLIRGLNGARVPVFVDGIPIQMNNHFHSRVDRYSSDMADRIEITRGPSVLKHGASAVGGVVDIYTRTPDKGVSGFVQAAYGTYNTKEVFGDVGYGWDSGSVLISGSDRLTEGPPVVNGPSAGVFAAEAHDLTNVNFKVTQALGDKWSIGLRGSNAVEKPQDMNFQTGTTHTRFAQDETDAVVHLDRKTATSNTLIALHDNTLDNFGADYVNGKEVAGTRGSRKETETGVLGRHTWLRSGGNTITAGVHLVKYVDDRFLTVAKVDKTEHISSYVQVNQGISDSVRVDGGVRVTKGDDFSTDVSPEIGVVKKIDASLAVRARAGKAFRVPRIGETDVNFNSTIEPEDFYHAEVGLNQRYEKSELDVTAWWMGGDNLIVRLGGGRTTAFYDNSGEFNNRGFEALFTHSVTRELSTYAGWTVMELETTGSSPQTIYDLGMEYRRGSIRGNLDYRDASRNSDSRLEDEDYRVLDGRLQYSVTRNIDVFVDVDNITDESYVTYFQGGFASFAAVNIERTVMGGVRAKF